MSLTKIYIKQIWNAGQMNKFFFFTNIKGQFNLEIKKFECSNAYKTFEIMQE